jgi:hypothetical protein
MKIRVLSDLHLEFTRYEPKSLPSVGEDLVVLAGDIGVGTRGVEWAKAAFPDRPVVYVLGNHEFYGEDWTRLIVKARAAVSGSNVHLLENERFDLGPLRVLGCSLWTDFKAMGEAAAGAAMYLALEQMTDYRTIRKQQYKRRLRPFDTISRCLDSRRWLEQEIAAADRPVLVVTHHAPTTAVINPQEDPALTAAFHNRFEELIRPPVRAWIHGHTHYTVQTMVNGISLVSNQRGYPDEGCGFDWDYCINLVNLP